MERIDEVPVPPKTRLRQRTRVRARDFQVAVNTGRRLDASRPADVDVVVIYHHEFPLNLFFRSLQGRMDSVFERRAAHFATLREAS